MAARLTVRYYRSEIVSRLQSYDLRVVVENAVGMPKEILVFQRGAAPAPGTNEPPSDQFVCIADPADIETYPIGAPDLENNIPYFRMSEVTLRFRDMATLQDTQDLMATDFQRLVDSINAADTLDVMTEVTYV